MATQIYYSDISKLGKDLTGNKDISILTNEQALLESVKNILITEPGERVMNPLFGCSLSQYLFQQSGPVMVVSMQTTIEHALRTFENRIDNLDINIAINPDTNAVDITILFNMKTSNKTQTLTLELNKIR